MSGRKKCANAALLILEHDGHRAAGWAYHDPAVYPDDESNIATGSIDANTISSADAAWFGLDHLCMDLDRDGFEDAFVMCYGSQGARDAICGTEPRILGVNITVNSIAHVIDRISEHDPNRIRYELALRAAEKRLDEILGKPEQIPVKRAWTPIPGKYIIYEHDGYLDLGRVKSIDPKSNTAFVWFSAGTTASQVRLRDLRPLRHASAILSATLGGSAAQAEFPEQKTCV